LVTSVLTKRPLLPNSAARALPASVLRSQRANLAPAPANNRAVAAPKPEAPPVITATLPASCMRYLLCRTSLYWYSHRRQCNPSRRLSTELRLGCFSSARNSGRTFLKRMGQSTIDWEEQRCDSRIVCLY